MNRSFSLLPAAALGGGELAGDQIVQIAFLDEAGISHPSQEPVVIVAGVIINADKQWREVESHIAQLRRDYMPSDAPADYPFHATELFSGGKFFRREKFTKEERWAILDKLVAVPAQFGLPFFFAPRHRSVTPDLAWAYTGAFVNAASCVEAYMRMLPDRNEVAMLILEDNHQVRNHVRYAVRNLKNYDAIVHLGASLRDQVWLTRVMGEPRFEAKSAISPLQIADACAFAAKRQVMDKPHARRFFKPLTQ